MRRPAVPLSWLLLAAMLAACAAPDAAEEAETPAAEPPVAETGEGAARSLAAATLPAPGSDPADAPIPHIYLALQPAGPGHPTSVVFAIDRARDGTPSDDPAVRLTPDAGKCNPQEMRRYAFPPDAAPAVSEPEQARGLTARDLPSYLAAAVTGRLIEAGLAAEPEETRGLNICTRKLWERLVAARNSGVLSAGQ